MSPFVRNVLEDLSVDLPNTPKPDLTLEGTRQRSLAQRIIQRRYVLAAQVFRSVICMVPTTAQDSMLQSFAYIHLGMLVSSFFQAQTKIQSETERKYAAYRRLLAELEEHYLYRLVNEISGFSLAYLRIIFGVLGIGIVNLEIFDNGFF